MAKKVKKTNGARFLDKHAVSYELVEYRYDENDLNALTICQNMNLPPHIVYKTLIAVGDKSGIIVTAIPSDHELSLKELAAVSGNKKIQLLPLKDLQKETGYIRGGCSPLGLKKAFPLYVAAAIQEIDEFYVNAGTRGTMLKLSTADFIRAAKPTPASISH